MLNEEKKLIEYGAVYQYAFRGVHGGGLEDEDFNAIINAIDAVPAIDADRMYVAPCKMGEPIYIVITKIPKPGFPQFTFIKRSRLTEHNFFRVLREIGKTIFLTKEEAEAKKAQIEGDNICQED